MKTLSLKDYNNIEDFKKDLFTEAKRNLIALKISNKKFGSGAILSIDKVSVDPDIDLLVTIYFEKENITKQIYLQDALDSPDYSYPEINGEIIEQFLGILHNTTKEQIEIKEKKKENKPVDKVVKEENTSVENNKGEEIKPVTVYTVNVDVAKDISESIINPEVNKPTEDLKNLVTEKESEKAIEKPKKARKKSQKSSTSKSVKTETTKNSKKKVHLEN